MNVLHERFLKPLTQPGAFPSCPREALQAVQDSASEVRDAWLQGSLSGNDAERVSHALKLQSVRYAAAQPSHEVAMRVAFASMAAGVIDGILCCDPQSISPRLVAEHPQKDTSVAERGHTDGNSGVFYTQVTSGTDRYALGRVYNDGARLGNVRGMVDKLGAENAQDSGQRSMLAAIVQLESMRHHSDRFAPYMTVIAEECYQAGALAGMVANKAANVQQHVQESRLPDWHLSAH